MDQEIKEGEQMKDTRTLILLKPDGVKRGIIGKIIERFEQKGLRLIGMKMTKATQEQLEEHYPDSMAEQIGEKAKKQFEAEGTAFPWDTEEYGMIIVKQLREYIKKTPIIAAVFQGPHAPEAGRKVAGETEPREARPGTVRGDFHTESYEYANKRNRPIRNLIHAADKENAEKEIKIWFNEDELYEEEYERAEEEIMRAPQDGPKIEDLEKKNE